jgi:alkylated DNA repair protein alkB family protein 5
VKPGVQASRLRSEAARIVEEEAMLLEAAAASLTSSPAAASAPRKSRGSRKRGGKAKGMDDDEGEWLTVAHDGKPREKPKVELTEEEKLAKQSAQQQRQNMKVQSTMTEEYRLTRESLQSVPLFTPDECEYLEALINQVVVDAERGLFKERTVDLTPMRNKYFFGFAYTYGAQKEHPGARGIEAVWPPEETSEIPLWISDMVISRLEARKIVPKGWVNSATINDYAAGGCIVSHIDPPHLFDRPIASVSMFSDCNLVFGTQFKFPKEAVQDIETSTPVLVQACPRGFATVLKGYSANKITHAIRPCDLPSRRASIILRRVLPSAPVLVGGKTIPLSEHLK